MYVVANNVISEAAAGKSFEQLDLFTDYEEAEREDQMLSREKELQKALLKIKKKYGKNAVLKGMNFEEGATSIARNKQVGGHRA